jgi:hypothetical protein
MEPELCFIMTCGEVAAERVSHPDRGLVEACEYHARRVRGLRRPEQVAAGLSP